MVVGIASLMLGVAVFPQGMSDPYVVLTTHLSSNTYRTKVIKVLSL
jgi:hypothetical protein